VLSFGADGARKEGQASAGRILLDRSGDSGVEDLVVRDRRHLAADGVVVPVVVVDRRTGELRSRPDIVSRGFMDPGPEAELFDDARRIVAEAADAKPSERFDRDLVKERMRLELRRFLKKRTLRRPMVVPVVMEV
jgi:ribonuclease J